MEQESDEQKKTNMMSNRVDNRQNSSKSHNGFIELRQQILSIVR